MSVDGGLTWENFSNAPSHVLYSSAGNNGYQSGICRMIFIENGAISKQTCYNGTSYTFGDVVLKTYVPANGSNADSYYQLTNNSNKDVIATNLFSVNDGTYTIKPGETLKIMGMGSASSCVFMW